jgi:hypothetical protein
MFSLALATATALVSAEGPCDIYDKAGTPCVAAHSMTRALYGAYTGPLYSVKNMKTNATMSIPVDGPGGTADSAKQDAFCGADLCRVMTIFDQSAQGNHIATAPPGGAARKSDLGVNATKEMLTVGGKPVYAAVFEGGMGYRRETTTGIATGDDPESMYMVTAGKRFNGGCCFDYGNAEIDAKDHGAGTMEAIYWGNSHGWGHGAGTGPWVMADLENGLWAGNERAMPQPSFTGGDFATAMVKGDSGNHFALKGGNAQQGELDSLYDGARPNGYHPMKKQGAIILGIGGDNSDWAIGTFYEGVMTKGFSSDATDAAVQANIVAAGYKAM